MCLCMLALPDICPRAKVPLLPLHLPLGQRQASTNSQAQTVPRGRARHCPPPFAGASCACLWVCTQSTPAGAGWAKLSRGTSCITSPGPRPGIISQGKHKIFPEQSHWKQLLRKEDRLRFVSIVLKTKGNSRQFKSDTG